MKIVVVFALLLLTLGAVPVFAASTAPDSIQTELDAILALTRQRPPEGTAGADHYRWFDGLTRRLGAEAFAFIEKYPTDPRRWRAALILQQRRFHPRFVISIGDDYATAGEKAVVRDTAAEEAWSRKVDELEKTMRAAADVPDEVREQVEFGDLMQVFQPAYRAAAEKQPADVAGVERALTAFLQRWPASESGRGSLPVFVQLKRMTGSADEEQVLAAFADSPNASARDYVRDRLRFFALSKEPFSLAFTALDGREVSLEALRGKVVLIDFWATWCGPCIAEIPNVRDVYAKYHDRGFEIIGVSLDDEKDRSKFIDLVAKEGVTWPQRFQGKGWKDDLAKAYTISGIPAMFLLDADGRLVTTNARGPKLEQEVRRLLKL